MPTFALGALWRPDGRHTKTRHSAGGGLKAERGTRGRKAQYPHFTVPSNTQQVKLVD